ncbi:hypothetical protein FO519_006610 [Halicephalobus sp. NKZ332]|nr:hypothetical protein FO519_006610 [Halicephalobus sp. NKZ332]
MLNITAEKLENALFTTSKPNEKAHRCVMVFDNKRAITYQHGSHSSFKKDQKVILYNVVNSDLEIEVVVSVVSEDHDFVIFELANGEFPYYPHRSDSMYRGQDYRQLGVDQKREPVWKDGMISKRRLGCFLGTTHGEHGDSGSGIFNLNGSFIGISVAKKRFALSSLQISGSAFDLEPVADHHPETKLISADAIYLVLKIDDDDDANYEPFDKKPTPGTE